MINTITDIVTLNYQVKLLKEQIELLTEIKNLNEQLIIQKDERISVLEKALEETFAICQQYINIAKKNSIKSL